MSGNAALRSRSAPPRPSDLVAVQRLVHDRPLLRVGFAQVWRHIDTAAPATQETWASATLALLNVNAGPACILAFWQLAAPRGTALAPVLAAGHAAADICRFAGARAALACLEVQPIAARLLRADPLELAAWWAGLTRLAREAPSQVLPLVGHADALLTGGDAMLFTNFVAAGLKATVRDKRRQAAFFAMQDPLAKALLQRHPGTAGFAESERMLAAYAAGLWGGEPRLRAGPAGTDGLPRRTTIASGTVILPPLFPGVPAGGMRDLYRAAVAHAHAHLITPSARQAVLTLKPMQLALIGLVEDARVEALAIRRYPGLRALWAGFHVARPGGALTAVALLARLARALLDPDAHDPDGFVQRGRALFTEAAGRLDDPAMSRAIGGLLGNDLGQMRVQFNAKTYVVEPAYRDDNNHMWDLPDAPDNSFSLMVDTARGSDGAEGGEKRPGAGAAPRARSAGTDEQRTVLAHYPEWDAAARVERPDWTTVWDTQPALGPRAPDWAGEARLRSALARTVHGAAVGRTVRQARREEGEALDLDAAIDAAAAWRTGRTTDPRLYRDRRAQGRDLATLVVLDVSHSTGAIAAAGLSVLDAERIAVTALAEALEIRGDRYALRAFASSGREDVRLVRLKDFTEVLGPPVHARLAGLSAGLSTRLGAALRHSGAELAPLRTTRKMVLVLTDGEPSDIDVADPAELVEDARRAVLGLRLRGIDVFGIVMDPAEAGSGTAIFGRYNTMAVKRLEDLPARLAGVYFRLAQR